MDVDTPESEEAIPPRHLLEPSDGTAQTKHSDGVEYIRLSPISDSKRSFYMPTLHIPSAPPSVNSLPDSEFDLGCRCGRTGDGNKTYNGREEGDAIQCELCQSWSHKACQTDGKASSPGVRFKCHMCTGEVMTSFKEMKKAPTRKSERM